MCKAGVRPDLIAYNAFLSCCAKTKQLEQGVEVFAMMRREQVQPDVITFNALLSCCQKEHHLQHALEMFEARAARARVY